MSPPVFVVAGDRLAAGNVVVDGAEGHHAVTVLRLRPGERVVLVDGRGRRADGVLVSTGSDRIHVDVPVVREEPPPAPRFVVVQALPKGERGEVAVQTLTEVGVDVVVPWAAARCVTRWREGRGDKALAKWRSAAVAAGKQSRRARFPDVTEPASTADVAGRLAGATIGAVLQEEATERLAGLAVPASGEVVVVVGPEGGITTEELDTFRAAGAAPYRLGDTVLRTSTAGTAALAVLMSRTRWR